MKIGGGNEMDMSCRKLECVGNKGVNLEVKISRDNLRPELRCQEMSIFQDRSQW
jgi:hypothetical protein